MTDAENALKEAEKEKKALNTYALVVNEKDQSSAEYRAAQELNKYLLQITGRDYTVCTADELELGYDKRCHYISIGDNAIFNESPYKTFGGITAEDGFFVKADGNSLFIGGNSDRALLYGAYELLRELGCEFFTADCEYVPSGIEVDASSIDIVSQPEISLRQYLAYETCYDHTEAEFAVKSGVNTSYAAIGGELGGTVKFGYLGADTHNARFYVGENYFGTEYCPANDLAVGGYVPCLTNGIDCRTGADEISTLSIVTENMKRLILQNPSVNYFTFEQEDGKDGAYCTCDKCVTAAQIYGRSGVLVRFCNRLIENLRADSELSGRNFKIVTFAYEYTKSAPKGGIVPDRDLCIWYAAYSDMRYSLFSAEQRADFKDDLLAWKALTASENSGSLILWLYDESYNNYLTYFGTTMSAIDAIVDEVVEMKAEMLLVLGAYDADNIWHSEMRNYIWTRKMANRSLKAEDLRDKFIENYFGAQAASYIRAYCEDYDSYYSDNDANYPVKNGNEYYSRVSVSEHCTSLQRVLDAIAAVKNSAELTEEQKNIYLARLYRVQASSYTSLLYYFESYYKAATKDEKLMLGGEKSGLFGTSVSDAAAAKTAFISSFKEICANAGITRCREGTDSGNTVENFIENNIGKLF